MSESRMTDGTFQVFCERIARLILAKNDNICDRARQKMKDLANCSGRELTTVRRRIRRIRERLKRERREALFLRAFQE